MNLRLLLSGGVSFVFYFAWAYWANNAENIPASTTLQAALVQGAYSGFVTLFFTFFLEKIIEKYGENSISLAFITPILCKFHSQTKQNKAIRQTFNHALNVSARFLQGKKIAGVLLAPLLPVAVQGVLVVMINVINNTPNLLLTVIPSIFFTMIYAYSYTFTLVQEKS